MAGNASIFLQDANFAPADPAAETGFNGIDYHPDGFLVVAHYSTNKMYRVPLADPSTIAEINLPQGMVIEPDGIEVDGNQLAVVNLGRIAGSISLFNMTSDWSAGMPMIVVMMCCASLMRLWVGLFI